MQMAYYSEHGKPHDQVDHAKDLESLNWREDPKRLHANTVNSQYHTQTQGDAASFCTTKRAMELVDYYDEDIVGWSFWQLSLQADMAARGVQFWVIQDTLMWHMLHSIEGPDRCLTRAQEEFNRSRRRQGMRNNYVPDA